MANNPYFSSQVNVEQQKKAPRPKKKGSELLSVELVERGSPRWTISFADLLSLLLIFFVLLFSMSTTSKVKYQQSIESMQKALLSKKQIEQLGKTDAQNLSDIQQAIDSELKRTGMNNNISTQLDNNGVRIIVNDSIFYASGEANLLESATPILNTIGKALLKYPYKISIEGHTDNIPISTEKYPSNWELSSARASSVVKHFINTNNINPKRLVAIGYADNRPIAANNSDANRAKNRRVEIKILPD